MSKTSALLDLVCAHRERMKVVLALCIAMGLLLGFSALYVGPGDEVFPILVLDAVLVGGVFAASATSFWYCTKREMDA